MNNSTILTEDTKLLVKCIESVDLMTTGELYDDYDRRGHILDYFVLSEGLWIPVDEVRKSDNHHVTVKITLNDGNELFFPYNSYIYPLRGNVSVLDLKLSDILRVNYIPAMPVFIKDDTNTCSYSHYLGRVLGYFLSRGKRVDGEYKITLNNDTIMYDTDKFTDREFEIVKRILDNAIIELNTNKFLFADPSIYEIQPDDITVSCSPNNNSRTYTINNDKLIDFFKKFSVINNDGIPNIDLKALLNGIEFNNGIVLGLKEMNRVNGWICCRNKPQLETYEAYFSALGISRISAEPSKDRITYFEFLQDMPPNGCYIYDNYYRRFGLGITKIEKINTDKKVITITKKLNDSSDIYPITLANGILVS